MGERQRALELEPWPERPGPKGLRAEDSGLSG